MTKWSAWSANGSNSGGGSGWDESGNSSGRKSGAKARRNLYKLNRSGKFKPGSGNRFREIEELPF